MKERGRITCKKLNTEKWMCTETGFVSTSGPLTLYQRKRGIDTSKRKRVDTETLEELSTRHTRTDLDAL